MSCPRARGTRCEARARSDVGPPTGAATIASGLEQAARCPVHPPLWSGIPPRAGRRRVEGRSRRGRASARSRSPPYYRRLSRATRSRAWQIRHPRPGVHDARHRHSVWCRLTGEGEGKLVRTPSARPRSELRRPTTSERVRERSLRRRHASLMREGLSAVSRRRSAAPARSSPSKAFAVFTRAEERSGALQCIPRPHFGVEADQFQIRLGRAARFADDLVSGAQQGVVMYLRREGSAGAGSARARGRWRSAARRLRTPGVLRHPMTALLALGNGYVCLKGGDATRDLDFPASQLAKKRTGSIPAVGARLTRHFFGGRFFAGTRSCPSSHASASASVLNRSVLVFFDGRVVSAAYAPADQAPPRRAAGCSRVGRALRHRHRDETPTLTPVAPCCPVAARSAPRSSSPPGEVPPVDRSELRGWARRSG